MLIIFAIVFSFAAAQCKVASPITFDRLKTLLNFSEGPVQISNAVLTQQWRNCNSVFGCASSWTTGWNSVAAFTLDGNNYATQFPFPGSGIPKGCPQSNPQLFLSIVDNKLQIDLLNVDTMGNVVSVDLNSCSNPGSGLMTKNVTFPYISAFYPGIYSIYRCFCGGYVGLTRNDNQGQIFGLQGIIGDSCVDLSSGILNTTMSNGDIMQSRFTFNGLITAQNQTQTAAH